MVMTTEDPGLKVTEVAVQHIKESLAKSSNATAVGIRVGVRKAGCSGFEYMLEYAYTSSITEMDNVFEYDEVKVVVDKEIYLKFIKGGTVLDFRREGLNEGFKFDNPNVANQCGCGESFTLK